MENHQSLTVQELLVSKRQLAHTRNMKVIAAVVVLAVVACTSTQAQPQPQLAALTSLGAAAGPTCFPERRVACTRHFSLYPNINCEGICGLCELCDAAKVSHYFSA